MQQAYHTPSERRSRLHEQRNCGRSDGIFNQMLLRLRTTARTSALAAILAAGVAAALLPAAAPAASSSAPVTRSVNTHALLNSRLLWSTIDVCNPTDQPDTIGVRGSMPGDGQAHDTMYMRFRLQYMNTTTKTWTDLARPPPRAMRASAPAPPQAPGRAQLPAQPGPGQPAFTLRGVVNFQWRHGRSIVAQGSRPTSAGRESLAGSDPAGFSTATCLLS